MAIVRVKELVSAFEKCGSAADTNRIAADCTQFLQSLDTKSPYFAEGPQSNSLLGADGEEHELTVIVENISTCPTAVAAWLAGRAKTLFSSSQFIFEQCKPINPTVTPLQEHIIGCLCRIPDLISNALKYSVDSSLLPTPLFTILAHTLIRGLDHVHQAIKDFSSTAGVSCSTVFLATLIGKLALLGHKDVIIPVLVRGLEERTKCDPLWERIAHTLFSHIPDHSLEPVMDAVMAYTSPSLSHPTVVRRLLGDLVLLNPKAKFLLTHKAFLVKVPNRRQALFNLIGYLSDDKLSRAMLVQALLALLGVWGSVSSLRHMDHRQHMWLAQLLVLSSQQLDDSDITPVRSKLQHSVMTAIQAHIDCPVAEVRHVGMAVGECLMNWLNSDGPHPLAFEYEPNDSVEELRKLASPSAVQEELKAILSPPSSTILSPPPPSPHTSRFGEGLVTPAADATDSDDDLVPYAIGEDPDSELPSPPRYLRACLPALLSPGSPAHLESTLGAVEALVRAQPPDLAEVAMEMTKVLLHLSDNYGFSDFVRLRHRSLVALAVCCPQQAVPYLTTELYAANYSIRQRIDILEVISAAALELSTPQSSPQASIQPQATVLPSVSRPWEGVVRERIRAKTRVICKGPQKVPPAASPNRFAPVAALFFFPLMCGYDRPLNTLDLLGADSLILGSLLHTLGVVIHSAEHAPLLSRMAPALMDFVWSLRYHPNIYVRQGILFALAMMLEVTHFFPFVGELEDELSELVQWLNDVVGNDSDSDCRMLARQSLAFLKTSLQEMKLNVQ